MIKRFAYMICLLLCCTALTSRSAQAGEIDRELLKSIVGSESRAAYNKARDRYRHPLETLIFSGIEPEMTVAELWPGGDGYYAEIIGQYLADTGQYISVVSSLNPTSEYGIKSNERLFNRFDNLEDMFGEPIISDLSKDDYDFADNSSLDMVVSFRNYHNWYMGGYDKEILTAILEALKPGGTFLLIEHRLDGSTHNDDGSWGGYLSQSYITELVTANGFELVDSSEINQNSKDTKDYPGGVWSLPPTLRNADENRDKYLEIGESDRMTLLFKKPDLN